MYKKLNDTIIKYLHTRRENEKDRNKNDRN